MSTSKPSGLKAPSKIGRPANAGVAKTTPSAGKGHPILAYKIVYNMNNIIANFLM